MPIEIEEKANEGSTIIFAVTFKDEDGKEVAPTSATYTVTDMAGTVIDNQDDVEIESPTANEDIVLTGSNLPIISETNIQEGRICTIEARYNSDRRTGLYLKESIHFTTINLKAATAPTS